MKLRQARKIADGVTGRCYFGKRLTWRNSTLSAAARRLGRSARRLRRKEEALILYGNPKAGKPGGVIYAKRPTQ